MKAIPANCPLTVIQKDDVGAIVVYICPQCRLETLEPELRGERSGDLGELWWVMKCNRCGAEYLYGWARAGAIEALQNAYTEYISLVRLLM